ncbi:MAG: 4Fe-4S binding protein [Helicobacter sp.]|nr:4Fe-4S binding protein [Helicobacter sp.]
MDSIKKENMLPLGVLLLDKQSAKYKENLAILDSTQEIFDDFLLEKESSVNIKNSLGLIFVKDENKIPSIVKEFSKLCKDDFEILELPLESLSNFSGRFGEFSITLVSGEIVSVSQAVLFVENKELLKFRGVYSVADFSTPKALLEKLKANLGEFSYKELISFKSDYCQFVGRREEHCAKCAEVCPTFGISADKTSMLLNLSAIDCINCGACVGVCPTNCLEYEELPKEGLEEIIELYKDKQIFLCDKKGYLELVDSGFKLPENLTPLVLPNLLMLNENDILSMIQISGYAVIVAGFLTPPMIFINNITQAIFKKAGILSLAEGGWQSAEGGKVESLQNVESVCDSAFPQYFYKTRHNKPFRESFAERVRFFIKDGDYGIASSVRLAEDGGQKADNGEQNAERSSRIAEGGGRIVEGGNAESASRPLQTAHRTDSAPVLYGNLSIDSSLCTMCLSCVGACNINAIFARESDFTLRFNPSLCTTCGYCVSSCPEHIITLSCDGMELNENYFKSREVAKDEAFYCVECGKPFSTKKSVLKVLNMLSVTFSGDEKKLRSLECCADCKVKVMFGAAKEAGRRWVNDR